MHRTHTVPWVPLGGLCLLGLVFSGVVQAQPMGGGMPPMGGGMAPAPKPGAAALIVPINGTQRLQMTTKKGIRTAINEKEQVAAVSEVANDRTSVLIRGLSAGTTRITLTDDDNTQETYEVIVQLDIELLKYLIKQAVPTAAVTPVPGAGNVIILTGSVAHAEDIQTILSLAGSIVGGSAQQVVNAMRVGGVQQVQLDVVVARVTRRENREMAFDFLNDGRQHILASMVGGAFATPQAGITGTFPGGPYTIQNTSIPGIQGANIFFGLFDRNQDFFGFLRMLRTEGLAKLLAEPRMVCMSGRSATFLSGGDQAVPQVSGFGGTAGVSFEPFGTRLTFLPIVMGNGRIYLEVEPEVSALDPAFGTPLPGTTGVVPGRITQRVRTSILMEEGQTFCLGGLIQHTVTASTRKVPFLGDLPFIGAAFSQKQYQDTEEEMLVLVTPHVVDPMDCSQLPKRLPGQETRKPDDFELFLEGILEAPRGSRQVCHDGMYVPAYKNDPTFKTYPCAGCGRGSACKAPNGNAGNCGSGSCGNGSCGSDGRGPGEMYKPVPVGQPAGTSTGQVFQPSPLPGEFASASGSSLMPVPVMNGSARPANPSPIPMGSIGVGGNR